MHRIKPEERKHQDYLRQRTLKVSRAYEARLCKLRAREVQRVLRLCKDVENEAQWAGIIENNIQETYLPRWIHGLFLDCGVPTAKSTSRDMRKSKADADDLWLRELDAYATERAGQDIVSVTGTLKETLIDVLQEEMSEELGIGVEKLTKNIFAKYQTLAKWQVRRIAQTESMIAMADAAHVAAQTLDVGYTKQWCISGLGNTRESHYVMDGVEVDENEPFYLENGVLMYPHDTSLNAPANEIINCACCCIRRPK